MAINIPIITEFSDKGLKSAQGAFNQFKTEVGKAQGAMGKFKAGSTVAFDTIKANAGMFALSAGAAIGGFALKAIGDFKDLALEVDEFRNKTDLTLQQSSQWVSYTGDLGISADTITKIFSRVAQAATDEIPAFEELGVAIALGPDGATDVEQTFLRVNDAINKLDDPVKQAAYRADLFGRGWMDAAEILQMSSSDIQTALAGVKDFEVIDEEEIQKAKDLRQAQDELGDAFARVAVDLGEKLIPVLTEGVDLFIKIYEFAQKFSNSKQLTPYDFLAYKDWETAVQFIKETDGNLDDFVDTLIAADSEMAKDIPASYFRDRVWREGYRALIDAATASDDLAEAITTVDDALAELTGNIDERRTFRKIEDDVANAEEAIIKAFTEGTPEAIRQSQAAMDDLRMDVAQYVYDLEDVPDFWQTRFIASLDQAGVDEVERILQDVARLREIPFMPTIRPGVGGIGEIGSGGRELGMAPIGFGITSAATNNVTINMPTGVQPNDVVKAINDWTRQNGSLTTPVTSSVRR